MKYLLTIFTLMAVVTLAPNGASCQWDFTGADFSTLNVGGSVYFLRNDSKVSNTAAIASIGEDGVLLVDTSFGGMVDVLRTSIDELGGGDIRYVINTHAHWDHTEANEFLGKEATIIAHQYVREFMMTRTIPGSDRSMPKSGWPVITVDSSLTIHFNGDEVQISAMPQGGHTGGDTVVYFKNAGVLCVGDYYFVDRFPVVDVGSGGSIDGYLSNLQMLFDKYPAETTVVPGHGYFPPNGIRKHSLGEMKVWADTLTATVKYVRDQKQAGVSKETLIEQGLPEQYAAFDAKPRFVSASQWIDAVYDSN